MAHRCKVCRRSFPSGRALGGHMRSHVSSGDLQQSPKKVRRLSDSGEMRCEECGREFASWRALFGHMRCHSEKSTPEERGGALDGSCSSAGEFNSDDEEENCAINLMRLSRGSWDALDKNGSALGDSGNFSRRVESRFDESDLELGKNAQLGEDFAEKRSQFECKPCNKVFHSYQALGGHKASHKRLKGCHGQNRIDINGGRNILETDVPSDEFAGGHQCVICGRVFNSGQALGGHMRSHLVMNSDFDAACPIVIQKQRFGVPELMDSNLHPSERGDELNSWWMGGNLKHEQLVGVISN